MAFCLIRHARSSFFSPRRSRKSRCIRYFRTMPLPTIQVHTLQVHRLTKPLSTPRIVSRLSWIAMLPLFSDKKSILSPGIGILPAEGQSRLRDSFIWVLWRVLLTKCHYDENIIVRHPINVLFLSLWLLSLDIQTHPLFWSFCYSSWIVSDSFQHVISPASAPMAFLSPPLQQYKTSPLKSSSSKHSEISTTAILTQPSQFHLSNV